LTGGPQEYQTQWQPAGYGEYPTLASELAEPTQSILPMEEERNVVSARMRSDRELGEYLRRLADMP
jgi:hypothetical protein